MKNHTKLLSVCLAIFILLSAFNIIVGATTIVDSGKCGDNLTWTLDEEGTLTISGTGEMYDYDINENPAPWYFEQAKIKNVLVCNGVTGIGRDAFIRCETTEKVDIADSVIFIGDEAFESCVNLTDISLGNGVTHIGFAAFFNCKALEYIFLPRCITYVDIWAFDYSGISAIFFEGTKEQWNNLEVRISNTYPHTTTIYCEFMSDFTIDFKLKLIYIDTNMNVGGVLPKSPKGSYIKDLNGDYLPMDTKVGTGMIFELPEGLNLFFVCLGDVDGNGKITASDARLALRASVGLENLSETQNKAADTDGDGTIKASDARHILRASVELEDPKAWVKNK